MSVFFDIFGGGNAEDPYKLLPKIPRIVDAHLESSLADVHIFGQHEHGSSPKPDASDKRVQPLPGDGLDLLIEPGMAHAHRLGELFHGKFLIINILLNYCYAFPKEVLVFLWHLHRAFL